MTGRTASLRLRVGRSSLRAEAIRNSSVEWAGEATYVDVAELSDAIARLAAEAPRTHKRIAVVVEHPPVQLRTLSDLPPVKPRHLVALVSQQAGRFFRKNGRPMVTDATWVGKSTPGIARAAAVEEPLVEAIAAGVRAAGLWLEAIAPAEEPHLSLFPPSERQDRERTARRQTRRLAVVTCGVWLTAVSVFFGRLAWERRAVERELAALQQPLAAVVQARRELRDAAVTLDAISAAERERGRALIALASVTSALPDSSVLTSLEWRADGTGILVGDARRAADVVARLDRLGTFSDARLGGPAVKEAIAGKDWERFSVLFGRERS